VCSCWWSSLCSHARLSPPCSASAGTGWPCKPTARPSSAALPPRMRRVTSWRCRTSCWCQSHPPPPPPPSPQRPPYLGDWKNAWPPYYPRLETTSAGQREGLSLQAPAFCVGTSPATSGCLEGASSGDANIFAGGQIHDSLFCLPQELIPRSTYERTGCIMPSRAPNTTVERQPSGQLPDKARGGGGGGQNKETKVRGGHDYLILC